MGPVGNILTYGLGSVAIFGGISILFNKFIGSDSKKAFLEKFKKDEKQKELQENIEHIDKEQQVIASQVRITEKSAAETQVKVKNILRKAAVEIQETLKQDSISEIDKQIDEDWKNL